MDMKLKTAFMSGLLSERINSLIDVLENSEKYSIEEIRDALSKTIDILKAIVGYIEINTVSSATVSSAIEYMLKINWNEIDKQEIAKSVVLLDLFTKSYCRYRNDYERFDDLKFRCDECPFSKPNGDCICKEFKNKYAPDYKDFGSMGDL